MPNRAMANLTRVLPLAAVALMACAGGGDRPSASYDAATRRLVQMASDLNGDGRVDQWTYMDGNRPVRAESDADSDGRIERWEYFDLSGSLLRVGTSSAGDGIEDTWAWAEDEAGERRVDISRSRDGAIDRREMYRGDSLVRVEEDANRDGRPDAWQTFENGRLREVRLDTTGQGRADRLLRYDADGHYVGGEDIP